MRFRLNLIYLTLFFVSLAAMNPATISCRETDSQTEDLLQPDSAKECAICHYSWVDTFFVEHKSSAFAELPKTPSADTAEMCYSCHDGSTVDSRVHIINDKKHQVGILPSDKVTIPDIFPLDKEGKMNCGTCHSAHGVSTEPGIEKTIFLRTSNKNSQMCRMCHIDKTGDPEKGHHPVDKTTLHIPDEIISYGGYTGNKTDQVICESCHVAHGGFTDKRLVLPVDRPSTHPVLCETCHGKAPGRHEDPDRNRFSHSVDIKAEKAVIPKKWKNKRDIRLGSQGEIVCITCHDTHTPAVYKSLLNDNNEKDSLCLQCHATQNELLKETKHDLSITAPDAKNIMDETVSRSGPCSCCHLMHEGVGPFMWARKWTGNPDAPVGICKSCHDENKCGSESPVPETGHPIGISPDEETKTMDFPLYSSTGKKHTKGMIYCSSCHNSHQWDPNASENKGEKELKGDHTNSFLRTAHQGSELCLGCHKNEAAIIKTDHDLLSSAPDEKNIKEETPDKSGVCGTCHLAHGGADLLMWARKITDETAAPVMDSLCLDCHRAGGCAPEKLPGSISHGTNISLTAPAETKLPLYSKDGNKDQNGLVACSTCHNTHQWNSADPENISEDGTPDDSFLRLSGAGDSPLCKNCHQDKSYIKDTDHDLRITAPGWKNSGGNTPAELGLCLPCHSVHNAVSKPFIWSMDPGPSRINNWEEEFTSPKNSMTALCTGCHLKDSCAEKKVPEHGFHPNRLFMAKHMEKENSIDTPKDESYLNKFPLFTEQGKLSAKGDIVCSTCHDPHLWNSNQQVKGPGKESEGNVTTSFLRKDLSFSFCSDCHGEDAIYKFKYFHRAKGRKKDSPTKQEQVISQ